MYVGDVGGLLPTQKERDHSKEPSSSITGHVNAKAEVTLGTRVEINTI